MVGSVQVHNRRESAALDMKAYSHLSAEERIRIDELRNRDGLGVRQIAQAPAHILLPVARMGDGRAQEGVDAGKDRGATEGRMARRPAHADKPRVPLPVDLRETAEGAGPQAVPASRQAAPHAFEGQEVEGAAHSDARADHGPAEEGGLAP